VIWEAFKPDTEPRHTGRQRESDRLRELILAQLRRSAGGTGGAGTGQGSAAPPGDFAEESGGLY
jgi:hypothetical protein